MRFLDQSAVRDALPWDRLIAAMMVSQHVV